MQEHYDANKWLLAFGRISVPWKMINGKIELSIKDHYKWHLLQGRITECLHPAMEKALLCRAREYDYHGTLMTVTITDLYTEVEKLSKTGTSGY